MPKKSRKTSPHFGSIACCLQGGGALGAYQAGVIKALTEANYHPDWFVGTSIGAINAAICAGNAPDRRVEKLEQFWNTIATNSPWDNVPVPQDLALNKALNYWSATSALMNGQPGFFSPRLLPPQLSLHDDPTQLSYYDTSPLKATLEQLVDFDRINHGDIRLSVGAVEITTGEIVYFDTEETKFRPEHIMASGALPPGFPAVEIDGKWYWDGGISCNTPVNKVLTDTSAKMRLCFMIHLFDSYGMTPRNMDEVMKRKKDIEFSSRFMRILSLRQHVHELHYKIHYLTQLLSPEQRQDPALNNCIKCATNCKIALVRFLHQEDQTELSSKDYEFSTRSINKNIERGYNDGIKATARSIWNQAIPETEGIVLYDMNPTSQECIK